MSMYIKDTKKLKKGVDAGPVSFIRREGKHLQTEMPTISAVEY